jgi:hypothetical protein
VDIQEAICSVSRTVKTIEDRMPIIFNMSPSSRAVRCPLSDYMTFIDQVGYRVERVIDNTNYLIVFRIGVASVG